MCGIFGYVGKVDALPVLIEGLKKLEYRGYDSAGLALISDGNFIVHKKVGRVFKLEDSVAAVSVDSKIGIAHTRWATHGGPTEANAHPHVDCIGRAAVVHNGIIENYKPLAVYLRGRGHFLKSETDTEVIPHLIEDFLLREEKITFFEAFVKAVQTIKGSYALAAVDSTDSETIYAVHFSSPLILGLGNGENFLASDASPFVGKTDKVVYLNEDDIAVIKASEVKTYDLRSREKDIVIEKLETTLEAIQKGNFEHFMLKEIHEQPESFLNAIRGRINLAEGNVKLGGLEKVCEKISDAPRIIITACGTSWHAALAGEYMLEELAKIRTEVEYASEFRYRNAPISRDDVVFGISQSGETADTFEALKEAKRKGALTLGIVNVVNSTIARETAGGVYTHAGPEIGVASTKAFTSQLGVLALITLMIGREKGTISERVCRLIGEELMSLPGKIRKILSDAEEIKRIAKVFARHSNFLYLGRGSNFPTALEGALKLKEISYIHAEGYPAAEMKHGPIALVDKDMPVVFIVPQDRIYEKVMANIEEVKAREGRIIAVANEDDKKIGSLAEFVIRVPRTLGIFGPILNVVPLQLLAYYIALERGCDIDKPRNLAKSVTVE